MLTREQLANFHKGGVFNLLLRSTRGKYPMEDIEDAFMNSLLHWTTNPKENVTPSDIIGRARVCLLRNSRKEAGLRQKDGELHRGSGRGFHIQNFYDEDGNNRVEDIGYCDNEDHYYF